MDKYSNTYQKTEEIEPQDATLQPDEPTQAQETQDAEAQPAAASERSGREGRNFGYGSKLNTFAIRSLTKDTRAQLGHSSAYEKKCISALRDYARYLQDKCGLRDMAAATKEQYESYANYLKEQLENNDKSASTTSTYVSCINQVFATHGREEMRLNASEYGISRGNRIPNEDRAMPADVYKDVQARLQERYEETGVRRYASLSHSVALMNHYGLRFEEATTLKIGDKDLTGDTLALTKGDGMKNGRERVIKPRDNIDAARAAQDFVRAKPEFWRESLVPGELKYDAYQRWAYKTMDKICTELGYDRSFHSVRHGYAQERYSQEWASRTGVALQSPVQIGKFGADWRAYAAAKTGLSLKEVISLDKQCRLAVSSDLGHGRVSVTSQYLGR